MSHSLLGVGARGSLVLLLQQCLDDQGYLQSPPDGDFGAATSAAVERFQAACQLPATGSVDERCWQRLTQRPVPTLAERALDLVASFEGHGYTLAMGNFDGAWLTWGIIAFTLHSGSLAEVYQRIQRSHPECIAKAFDKLAIPFGRLLSASGMEKANWANRNTGRDGRLLDPWKTCFETLGSFPEVQQIQREVAEERYWRPAQQTARRYNLSSEIAMVLCFDIHVQNGGVKPEAARTLDPFLRPNEEVPEKEIREAVAQAVAKQALPRYRDDVLARKMTLAR